MIIIGLTGSIGMGKTTTAAMFRRLGVPVFDSDAVVHQLYGEGGEAVDPISRLVPAAAHSGRIDRSRLAAAIQQDPSLLGRIEAVVHPLVRAEQERFLEECRRSGELLALLDVPLLFETARDRTVDVVVVVTAPEDVQRNRVLSRPGMTEDKLALILSRQLPDAVKRKRAHYVVDTSSGIAEAEKQVMHIVAELKARAEACGK